MTGGVDNVKSGGNWHVEFVVQPAYLGAYSYGSRFDDPDKVTAVVIHSGTNVPSFFAMRGPALALIWGLESDDLDARRCNGCAIIVKSPVDMLIR